MGITPFLTTDFDLLHQIQQQILTISIKNLGQWVKGHYTGKNRQVQHDLNDRADDLATAHLDTPPTGYHQGIQ